MNKKTLIVLIIAIVALISAGFYCKGVFFKNTNQEQINQQVSENKLVTDDFEINLPEGWLQIEAERGASVMAINGNEEITDPAAQAINFRSYFAVSHEELKGKSMSEYVQGVKAGLIQLVTNISFTKDQDLTIKERVSHAIEAEMTQNGADFKILMVAIQGKNDDVWVVSFNTIKSNWDKYQESFYNTADTFNLKL